MSEDESLHLPVREEMEHPAILDNSIQRQNPDPYMFYRVKEEIIEENNNSQGKFILKLVSIVFLLNILGTTLIEKKLNFGFLLEFS